MVQIVQEVEVKDITCFSKCPVCGRRDAFEMPGDLGTKENEECIQACRECMAELNGYVSEDIKGRLPQGWNKATVFLWGLCDEGNLHAIALVKDLLSLPEAERS